MLISNLIPPVALLDSPWQELDESNRWRVALAMEFNHFPLTLSHQIDGKQIHLFTWNRSAEEIERTESRKTTSADIVIEDGSKKVLKTSLSQKTEFFDVFFPFPLNGILKPIQIPNRTVKIFSEDLEEWVANTRARMPDIEAQILSHPLSLFSIGESEKQFLAFQTFHRKLVRTGLLQGPVRQWALGQA